MCEALGKVAMKNINYSLVSFYFLIMFCYISNHLIKNLNIFFPFPLLTGYFQDVRYLIAKIAKIPEMRTGCPHQSLLFLSFLNFCTSASLREFCPVCVESALGNPFSVEVSPPGQKRTLKTWKGRRGDGTMRAVSRSLSKTMPWPRDSRIGNRDWSMSLWHRLKIRRMPPQRRTVAAIS